MLRLEQEQSGLCEQYKLAPPHTEMRPSTPRPETAAKEIFQPELTVSHPAAVHRICLRALKLYQTMVVIADALLHYPELPERLCASDFITKIPNHGLFSQRDSVR